MNDEEKCELYERRHGLIEMEVRANYLEREVQEMRKDIKEIKGSLSTLAISSSKQTSFVAGIAATVSVIWGASLAIIYFVKDIL